MLMTGGGKIARKYQAAAAMINEVDDEDWLDTHYLEGKQCKQDRRSSTDAGY